VKRFFVVSPFVFLASVILSAQTYKGTATCEFEFDLARKEFRQFCREAAPGPVPTPTPNPTPSPTPNPTPTPTPPPNGCAFGAESLHRVGVALHNIRPTSGTAIKLGYLGKVYVMNATPKSRPPYCPHQPDRIECEQLTCAQDKRGATIYMSLEGRWQNELCDPQSDNPYLCHHKPLKTEVGKTTFTACPYGAPPNDARCSSTVVDIR
jgi:hypothetical protein